MGADPRLAGQRAEQRVLDVDDLDAREPDPLHTRDPGHLHHQLAELEAAVGVAVVADADAGHDHLRLPLDDAAAHLLEHRPGRARAGRAPDGRDDAVRAVAVAAVLDLDEATRARGGRRALAGQQIVLEVGAGADGPGDRPRRRRRPCRRTA